MYFYVVFFSLAEVYEFLLLYFRSSYTIEQNFCFKIKLFTYVLLAFLTSHCQNRPFALTSYLCQKASLVCTFNSHLDDLLKPEPVNKVLFGYLFIILTIIKITNRIQLGECYLKSVG